jgi:hypothetical protein
VLVQIEGVGKRQCREARCHDRNLPRRARADFGFRPLTRVADG